MFMPVGNSSWLLVCKIKRSPLLLRPVSISVFFLDTPQPIFTGESFEKDMHAAKGCFEHLAMIFQELEECRAFELLKSTVERANYLMIKQAKIVAMICTHAALKRRDFLQLGFKYDNLLMEESAQILEIETFIPMLLQRQEDGYAHLKCCILIGDHHQLPPVVKNMAFKKYSHMDQSLFTRSFSFIINRRCKPWNIEPPSKTRFVGHLRDVRRLIVAMCHARLALCNTCNIMHLMQVLMQPLLKMAMLVVFCIRQRRAWRKKMEGSKMDEGNGEANDVVIEDKMEEENSEAKDKMEEENAGSKDKMEEENSEAKDKMEEENSEAKDKMEEENAESRTRWRKKMLSRRTWSKSELT